MLTSCVSAGFYLYIVQVMFMKERPAGERVQPTGGLTRLVIGSTAVIIIGLGLLATPLTRWADHGAPMTGATQGVVGGAPRQ